MQNPQKMPQIRNVWAMLSCTLGAKPRKILYYNAHTVQAKRNASAI